MLYGSQKRFDKNGDGKLNGLAAALADEQRSDAVIRQMSALLSADKQVKHLLTSEFHINLHENRYQTLFSIFMRFFLPDGIEILRHFKYDGRELGMFGGTAPRKRS